MVEIKNLPPDPMLYNWPYAPESDVPEGLKMLEYFESLADLIAHRMDMSLSRERARRRSADEMKWKLRGTPFFHAKCNQGESHPKAKLTTTAVKNIRALKHLTDKELSEMFNVSDSHINRVRNRQAWRHIK